MLFGGKKKSSSIAEETPQVAGPRRPSYRPFSDYPNPFATAAPLLSPDALVAYTFEALEAWAREHGCPREADETPQEFAEHLASAAAPLADAVGHLVLLYCQVAYAPGTAHVEETEALEQLWRMLSRR